MERLSNISLTWASSCSDEKKPCVEWVEKYFKDCVCSPSGKISFGLGIVSLICWGVAEVPQIITNFQAKSGHGVSLAFLLTWVAGDIFNLVGCLLEPATLPTQFYTALLYTISTVVLVLQIIYYDYILRWCKSRGFEAKQEVKEEREPLNPKPADPYKHVPTTTASIKASPEMDVYYTSARSLASSFGTPSYGSSYLRVSKSGPSGATLNDGSSSEEETFPTSTSTSHHHRHQLPPAKPKRIVSRSVGYGTFIAGAVNLPFQGKALMETHMRLSGRRVLQESAGMESNPLGLWLGWLMAAIYMGGRLPQIYLNIKRGSVEGLNPLMFIFALIANATYVGSILVRSVEWERTKANAPWLLDAIVCVLLDLFIIIQYAYYKYMHRRATTHEDDFGGYVEAEKPLA